MGDNSFDVIVVGAGMAGVACAGELTLRGARPLLVCETAEVGHNFRSVTVDGNRYTQTLTVGVNPADNLAAVLFAHRDRKTLAWSDTPLLDLPPVAVVPVDVPPWWRMKKRIFTRRSRSDPVQIRHVGAFRPGRARAQRQPHAKRLRRPGHLRVP